MLNPWIDDLAVLLWQWGDDSAPAPHPAPDPLPKGVAGDGGDSRPGGEGEQGSG